MRKPAHLVLLHGDAEGHGESGRDQGLRSDRQDQGKVEALKKPRVTFDSQQSQEMLAWVNACRYFPMFEWLEKTENRGLESSSPQMDPSLPSGRNRSVRWTNGFHTCGRERW